MRNKYTLEILQPIVEISFSYAEVARRLGVPSHGGAQHHIKTRIQKFNISVKHFCSKKWAKSNNPCNRRKTASETLVNKTETKTRGKAHELRRALLEIGRPWQCTKCKLKEWQGHPIMLQVHHIDGNPYNHTAENLMLICPNCHAQTGNFVGNGAKKLEDKKCLKCEKIVSKNSKSGLCQSCYWINRKNKKIKKPKKPRQVAEKRFCKTCQRPVSRKAIHCKQCSDIKKNTENLKFIITKEELQKIIWEMPSTKIALLYNVSDKAVEKRCKKLGIEKPPRGYWAKMKAKIL